MTSLESPAAKPKISWSEALAVYLKPRVLIVLMLGFSAGLPLALTGSTLSLRLRESNIDLGIIGLFALAGTPYTIKFLWAPLVDALDLPVLSAWLGRRRGWLMLAQFMLISSVVLLAVLNPQTAPWYVLFGAALLVATSSATQDIVIDAFRIESLDTSEQAAGMASYVAAYRVANLITTAGVLFLVTEFESFGFNRSSAWVFGYLAMAALAAIGIVTTLVAREPKQSAAAEAANVPGGNSLHRVIVTAIGAFRDFLTRPLALTILAFVILYKFSDAFAGAMTAPFVIDLGFTRNDYATIVKGVGFAATIIGGFAGGIVARAYPLAASLWIAAFVQTVSNLMFSWLAVMGLNHWALTAAIVAENFTGAIGTVIFVAYLSALCNSPLHTATQFALLTALSAVGRTYLSAGSGFVAESTGWFWFFVVSVALAIPSFILLAWLQWRGHFRELDQRAR
jgi:PAT family beta-lactamase induction signal transducer AmpG